MRKRNKMKALREKNLFLNQTLAALEQTPFTHTLSNPVLTARCSRLRQKQLKDFTDEDLRIMIGQHIGLKYLIPIALERLLKAPLLSGNHQEGALFSNVVMAPNYWDTHPLDLTILREVRAKVPGMHNYVEKCVVKTMRELFSEKEA